MDQPGSKDPLHALRRQVRWLQLVVGLGLVAIAGALYWQSRVIGDDLANAQRPFVAFNGGKFLPVTGTGQPAWQFVGVWENAGNTSANDLRMQMNVWSGPGLQPGFTRTETSTNPVGPLTLGPRTAITIPDFTLPAETLLGAKQSPGFIAIWGVARYQEARSGRPSHTTRFCNYVTWVSGDPMHSTALDIRYNACGEGNCTDEACVAQGYVK